MRHAGRETAGQNLTKHGIDRETLTVHADNDPSTASKPVAFLLADRGVTKTHSGPTAQATTRTARRGSAPEMPADFPEWFGLIEDA